MAQDITPTAGSAAQRRAAWSLGIGLLGAIATILVVLKIQLFGSAGYTLMFLVVGVLGRAARGTGATAWSDGRFPGRAQLGILLGVALLILFALVAGEVIHING